METVELGLDEIKVDFSTYGYRRQKDMLRVQQYQEILDVLPPVDVFDTPEGMVLVAGHHRYDAYIKERRQKIKVHLHQGTETEAKLFAIKSNVVHGLPLTRAERKQALRDFILICKEEDPKMSDRDIATAFGACGKDTVNRERRELVKEELLPLNTDELANLDGYITQHPQMLDAEIADVFGCHRSTVFRRRQDLLDSGVLEPESVAGVSNETVQQNEENDDQGDLFQTGGEAEGAGSETTDEYIERVEEGLINNPESVVETEPESGMVVSIGDVEIRTEADIDRAADQIPFVRNVKQWHRFCDQMGKTIRVMNQVLAQCGFEALVETLREEELVFECDEVQKWCRVISDKMDQIKGEV